jgi:hypothetical protein
MKVILPIELINHILTYRPVHPIAKIMNEEIKNFYDENKSYDYIYSNFYLNRLDENRYIMYLNFLKRRDKLPIHPISILMYKIGCKLNLNTYELYESDEEIYGRRYI